MMEYNEEEKYFVYTGMIKYGGGFVRALGEALSHADPGNTKIIKHCFSEYWEEYLPMGKKLYEKEQGGE